MPKALTKAQLQKEAEKQLRENSREVLGKFWGSVKRGLDKGEKHAMEMVARMYAYDKAPGGITIFNQHLQVNGAATAEQGRRGRSFDQIVNKLEGQDHEQRSQRLLTAADDDDEDAGDEDEIQDGETEEVEEIEERAEEPVAPESPTGDSDDTNPADSGIPAAA